jgi:hypothetical protein
MHPAVFDGDVGERRRSLGEYAVHGCPCLAHVDLHLGERGPVLRAILGSLPGRRVDSESEEAIQGGVNRGKVHLSCQQIPVKRLQMTDIEDEPVPFGYGAFEQSLRANAGKQEVGHRPGGLEHTGGSVSG